MISCVRRWGRVASRVWSPPPKSRRADASRRGRGGRPPRRRAGNIDAKRQMSKNGGRGTGFTGKSLQNVVSARGGCAVSASRGRRPEYMGPGPSRLISGQARTRLVKHDDDATRGRKALGGAPLRHISPAAPGAGGGRGIRASADASTRSTKSGTPPLPLATPAGPHSADPLPLAAPQGLLRSLPTRAP